MRVYLKKFVIMIHMIPYDPEARNVLENKLERHITYAVLINFIIQLRIIISYYNYYNKL